MYAYKESQTSEIESFDWLARSNHSHVHGAIDGLLNDQQAPLLRIQSGGLVPPSGHSTCVLHIVC
jgi:hypothetical protein